MVDGLIGIDVSSNNSSDWEDDVWDYGWVKATEGKSYANPVRAKQLGVIRNKGKVSGHYHWLNKGDVTAQVNWFKSQADVKPGDLIACDWETDTGTGTASCAQKDDWIKKVKTAFPNNKVGLYCNKDFWFNRDTTSFAGDYLWIADPNGGSDPGVEYEWIFHQYTWTPYDKNRAPKFKTLGELQAWAGTGGPPEPPDPVPPDTIAPEPLPPATGTWYSTDYLFPMVKPDPKNTAGIKKGDKVKVTASGGLTARAMPGGPPTQQNGEPLVRPTGYQFDVTGDPSSGWITGGSNWYSSDYLAKVTAPPAPSKPAWKTTPTIVLPMTSVPGSVSYLQGCMKVQGCTASDGKVYADIWIVAQDYDNKGDIRFLAFDAAGKYINWFQVNGAGHGQTFYAYRSAGGNLYVWCGEDSAYRHAWQPGKKVSKTAGTKMDYKGGRPMGGFKDRVAFRNATDTKETFSLFDRTDFTDNKNRTKPIKEVTLAKRTTYAQQSYFATESRIYRIYGKTDENCKGSPTKKHTFDVFDWSGKCLLGDFNVTEQHRSSSTECEPEGIAGTGSPGSILSGKREGPASASKRAYVLWEMTGLP